MVSDEYAAILKDLHIGTLQFIDTCGLDHTGAADQQELKDRLYEACYYYNERGRIKLEDISVFYLKKLDSGKPDELRQILPSVREVFPAAPVYCMFTGIDIFYRTAEEIDSLNWSCPGSRLPKAVSYLLSDDARHLLEDRSGMADSAESNLYLVMRNNLIPYCGKKHLSRANFSYYKNNTTYIWKMLSSIVMKEYSSLEIIDARYMDMIIKGISSQSGKMDASKIVEMGNDLTDSRKDEVKNHIENILDAATSLVKCIFSEASMKSCHFRYNTKQADITSFCKRSQLGYYGTYRHRMDQRFHEGYGRAVEKKGQALAQCFSPDPGGQQAEVRESFKTQSQIYRNTGGAGA